MVEEDYLKVENMWQRRCVYVALQAWVQSTVNEVRV